MTYSVIKIRLKKNSILRIRLFKITQGYWNRHRLIRHLWFPTAFYSNFIRKKHRFWDIRLQKCCDLEIWVRSPSRSLKMPPFDRAHMTSYWRSIVTMALSRVVSEIFNVENCRDLEIRIRGHSRSLKVVPLDRSGMVSYSCSVVTLSPNAPYNERWIMCNWTIHFAYIREKIVAT